MFRDALVKALIIFSMGIIIRLIQNIKKEKHKKNSDYNSSSFKRSHMLVSVC